AGTLAPRAGRKPGAAALGLTVGGTKGAISAKIALFSWPGAGMTLPSAGARFRAALAAEKPLQVIGAINANHALLAKCAGYRAIYLSGGGVAAGSLGL